jgi:hypothetical protein
MKQAVLTFAFAGISLAVGAQDFATQNASADVAFSNVASVALNVPGIQTFTIAPGEGHAKLAWHAVKEELLDRYEVERSIDGMHFEEAVATFTAGQGDYAMMDADAKPGITYYRVRIIAQNGTTKYSPTRTVRLAQPVIERAVYPTDNRTGKLFILLNPDTEDVIITVVGLNGSVLRVPAAREGRQFAVDLQGLPHGMYTVLVDAGGERSVHRVMYQQ